LQFKPPIELLST